MTVAKVNISNSIISNNSILKKLDPKNKVFVDIELILINIGIPQQKKWVKLVKTRM